MTEPDVTLTDYAIALECVIFCLLAARWVASDGQLRRWWIVFFASIGAGALFGGTVHGFFLDPASAGHRVLWPATLLALGVTSMAMWNIGARIGLREPAATWVRRAAAAQFVAYAVVVLFVDSRFVVAIVTYLPAAVFLLVVVSLLYARTTAPALAYGIAGLLLVFVAAAVQQLGIAVHPVYFNHNALYHVLQGLSLFLILLCARWITAPRPPGSPA